MDREIAPFLERLFDQRDMTTYYHLYFGLICATFLPVYFLCGLVFKQKKKKFLIFYLCFCKYDEALIFACKNLFLLTMSDVNDRRNTQLRLKRQT